MICSFLHGKGNNCLVNLEAHLFLNNLKERKFAI